MLVNVQGGLFLGLIRKVSLLVDQSDADIWVGHRRIHNVDFATQPVVCSVSYRLTRFLVQYALWQKTDELVIAIHPRHKVFYGRHLGFVRFGLTARRKEIPRRPADWT